MSIFLISTVCIVVSIILSRSSGSITFFRKFKDQERKKLSIIYQMGNFSIFDTAKVAVVKNILYSHIILTKIRSNKKIPQPIVSIDEFFYDSPNSSYIPLHKHFLEQSPCYNIIGENNGFYYCKVHPDIESIHLESIEHHCKYKEPDFHKSEIPNHCQLKDLQNV